MGQCAGRASPNLVNVTFSVGINGTTASSTSTLCCQMESLLTLSDLFMAGITMLPCTERVHLMASSVLSEIPKVDNSPCMVTVDMVHALGFSPHSGEHRSQLQRGRHSTQWCQIHVLLSNGALEKWAPCSLLSTSTTIKKCFSKILVSTFWWPQSLPTCIPACTVQRSLPTSAWIHQVHKSTLQGNLLKLFRMTKHERQNMSVLVGTTGKSR